MPYLQALVCLTTPRAQKSATHATPDISRRQQHISGAFYVHNVLALAAAPSYLPVRAAAVLQ